MKLSIVNHFPAPPDRLWDLFQDPAFEARLEETSGVRYHEVERWEEGGRECRKVNCESKRDLPSLVAKAIGSDHLSYLQVNKLDRARNALEWEVIPSFLTDKVTARGVTTCREVDGGTERRVEGEITVRLPLVGGRIERTIVQQVEQSYVRAAELALQMLNA